MDLFQEYYFGNTLQNWLCALITLIVALAALIIAQKVLLNKLSKLAATTDNQIDDLIVNMIKQTKFFILIIVSIYLASLTITIKPSIAELWQKVVILLLIFQAGLWASAGISFALGKIIKKRSEEDTSTKTTITFLGFVARFFLWIIIFLLILDNLGVNITGLVAGLGIGGIAVAMGSQKILGDIFSYLFILIDKPFEIGDYIVLGEYNGNIERIGLKTTRVRSLGGEQLVFSNSDIASSRIRNYKSMRERRAVFSIGVTYDTPVETLKSMPGIIKNLIEKNGGVRFDRAVFSSFGDYSLKFEAVYFVLTGDYKVFAEIQQAINFDILEIFKSKEIKFAFPTNTVYINKE